MTKAEAGSLGGKTSNGGGQTFRNREFARQMALKRHAKKK